MGDVINLRKARKKVQRQLKAELAAQNRISFGQSKSHRALEEARREMRNRELDRHRLESGEVDEVAGRETINRDSRSQDERES